MHRGMKFFYDNGGADCYIVSVGPYTDATGKAVVPNKDVIIGALVPLVATQEPTMVLTPDAAWMKIDAWGAIAKEVLSHCETLASRIAILDLVGGDQTFGQSKFGLSGATDPVKNFHDNVGVDGLSYGAAYYPWLNTNLIEIAEITFLNLSDDLKLSVQKKVTAEADDPNNPNPRLKTLAASITTIKTGDDATTPHQAMLQVSPAYAATMRDVLAAINVMPPSTAMAGVICRTDGDIGPWKAPANTSILSVESPTIHITSQEQEALNVPLDGMAINAIRTFANRGVLVWGARTLDGNSQDWRYVSVRRTMIMIEQSAKLASEAFLFEANDARTWTTLKAMLESFLTTIWQQGGLAGAKPADAFWVSAGLGSTMTATDILNGILNITIGVAVTHPAEFIILTFTQQMQTS
jgi:phage tail sheath protein FI